MSKNICLSGGAKGADLEWGAHAKEAGHEVVHWIFDGHGSKALPDTCILDREKLNAADSFLKIANKHLRRSWPTRNQHVNDLLRRNHYQVNWTDRVYAVASFGDTPSLLKITGGTAWACQLYVDRWLYSESDIKTCELYFFDQISTKWYQWAGTWTTIDKPPAPYGVYAGIGSRDLSEFGRAAIKEVYQSLSG